MPKWNQECETQFMYMDLLGRELEYILDIHPCSLISCPSGTQDKNYLNICSFYFLSHLLMSVLLQVQGCSRDLSQEKKYYKRYRVCMDHLKMKAIYVDGELARFCQQCGRFHDLSKFDGQKRCVE